MKSVYTKILKTNHDILTYIRGGLQYGVVYKVDRLDVEAKDGEGEHTCYDAIQALCDSVPEGVVTKVHLKSKLSFNSGLECYRNKMLNEGHRNIQIFISFNMKLSFADSFKSTIRKENILFKKVNTLVKRLNFNRFEMIGATVTNIKASDCPFFVSESEVKLLDGYLVKDNKYLSLLKLENLSSGDQNNEVHFSTLPNILKNFPLDFEMVSTFKKINRAVSEADLRVQTNRNHSPKNAGEYEKMAAKEEVLKQVELHGQSIALIDSCIIIETDTIDDLNYYSDSVQGSVGHLGLYKRQLKTHLEPYISTRVNCKTSSMQRERGPVIPHFLPLSHFSSDNLHRSENSIAFLREDLSPFLLDPSNKNYFARNGIVIGNTGRGKSVFLNTIIDSLIQNKNNYVILVDVKTSHTALTKKHNGLIHEIDIDTASCMSAFNLLELGHDKYIIQHIIDFITSLVEGSDQLKDVQKSRISNVVNSYINSLKVGHNLDDFILFCSDKSLPNLDNLKRWGREGIYSNVFKGNKLNINRLQYFDLKSIDAAGKPYITKAVIQSVMTQIYLLIKNKDKESKIFIVFDETPFFIKDNFESLAALSKNMRSMNGSTVFASQVTDDLLGPNGEETLFSQSNLRVLFSVDNKKEVFQRRTSISDNYFEMLKDSSKPLGNEKRKFVLSDDLGEKLLSIRLTSEELARSTTNPIDKEKISTLMKTFKTDEQNARRLLDYAYQNNI